MPRQRNDAPPAMTVAPRALHVTERHTDRGFRVTRLKTQVQIKDGAATVAGDNQPMMFEVSAAAILGQNQHNL